MLCLHVLLHRRRPCLKLFGSVGDLIVICCYAMLQAAGTQGVIFMEKEHFEQDRKIEWCATKKMKICSCSLA